MTDSLKIYETLKSELPEAHASVIAKAIGTAIEDSELHWENELVPKVDVIKFDGEMHRTEASINQHFASFGERMENRFESLTVRLTGEMANLEVRLRAEIAKLESKMMGEMAKLESKMMGEMAKLESRVMGEMNRLESRMMAQMSKLETRIANGKTEMIRWMFVFWVGQVAVMVAMIKLLK